MGEGTREEMKGWEEEGEELKAESSVRSRLVGVREEEEEVVDILVIWAEEVAVGSGRILMKKDIL